MKKIIEKLFPNLVRHWQIESVDKILAECLEEQKTGKRKSFIRAYTDEEGETWEVSIKFNK